MFLSFDDTQIGIAYFIVFLVMQPFASKRLKSRCCCRDVQRDSPVDRYAQVEHEGGTSIEESAKSVFSGPGATTVSSAIGPFLQPVYDYMDEEELAQEIESLQGAGSHVRDESGLLSPIRDSFEEQLLF